MKDDQKTKKQEEAEKIGSQELEELKQKADEYENKYKRALADYQNLEKRILEERRDWIKCSNKELILNLLPVLDTLIMVNNHVKDEGLALSIKQFSDILKKEGLEKIESVGRRFDPQEMECIGTENGQDGMVTAETRQGYFLNDKVLRPALVRVGKKEEVSS